MTRIERQRFLARSKLLEYVTNSFRKTVRLNGISVSQQKLFETQKSLSEVMKLYFSKLTEQLEDDEKRSKSKSKTRRSRKSQSPQGSKSRGHVTSPDKDKQVESETTIIPQKDATTGEVFTIASHKSKSHLTESVTIVTNNQNDLFHSEN